MKEGGMLVSNPKKIMTREASVSLIPIPSVASMPVGMLCHDTLSFNSTIENCFFGD
jgi:hypothetical protein